MSLLKDAARKAITWMPRSRVLAACCRHYCAHCGDYEGGFPRESVDSGELRLLRELAPALDVVLDVGANVGNWTAALLALRPSATIHAFEPAPGAHEALRRRAFAGNVSVHRTALSSRKGAAPLFLFSDSSELNSLHNRDGLEDGYGVSPATQAEEVELETADAFCASRGLSQVDFMKVDTEGHEIDVLLGSRQSLERGVIRRVQFEYGGTYIDSRRLLKDAFELFRDLPYVLFRIVPNGLVAFPRYDQRIETFQYGNFVALHRDTIRGTASAQQALQRTR